MPSKWNKTRKTAFRHNRIEIKMSDEELSVVKEKAKKLKIPVGRFIRKIAVTGEIKFYDLTELHALLYSFQAIGNTLNQIAKVANSTNSIYQKDIEEMQERFEYFDRVMENYLFELKPEKL